jgi:hypothetical protein
MATGVDLIGNKFYTANAFPNVEGLCTVAELGVHTVEEGGDVGDELDALWCEFEDPETGENCQDFSGAEEARAWCEECLDKQTVPNFPATSDCRSCGLCLTPGWHPVQARH